VRSNPYASPREETARPTIWELTDEQLATRLVDETSSRHEVFGDLADINLYGSKYRRTLSGAAAQKMIDAGLEPKVRQAVEWWCFVFLPVIPRETRIVVDYHDLLPDGDDHGRSIPTAMDWRQALTHATFGIVGLVIVAIILVLVIFRV